MSHTDNSQAILPRILHTYAEYAGPYAKNRTHRQGLFLFVYWGSGGKKPLGCDTQVKRHSSGRLTRKKYSRTRRLSTSSMLFVWQNLAGAFVSCRRNSRAFANHRLGTTGQHSMSRKRGLS